MLQLATFVTICWTAIPIDTSPDEAHSTYLRQFPFGNLFRYFEQYL